MRGPWIASLRLQRRCCPFRAEGPAVWLVRNWPWRRTANGQDVCACPFLISSSAD